MKVGPYKYYLIIEKEIMQIKEKENIRYDKGDAWMVWHEMRVEDASCMRVIYVYLLFQKWGESMGRVWKKK